MVIFIIFILTKYFRNLLCSNLLGFIRSYYCFLNCSLNKRLSFIALHLKHGA